MEINSPEIERAVLGMVLDDASHLDDIESKRFIPELFSENRRTLAECVRSLMDGRQTPDILTVSSWFDRNAPEMFESWGGRPKLLELQTSIPYAETISFSQYIEQLEEFRRRRDLITLSKTIEKLAGDDKEGTLNSINTIQESLFELLTKTGVTQTFFDIDQATDQVMEGLFSRIEQGDGLVGVTTGFRDLDYFLKGFGKGTMNIIAARPAAGKSSAALSFATTAAMDEKIPTVFFSLEMTSAELASRIISSRSKVPFEKMTTVEMSENDWVAISKAKKEYEDSPLYFEENPNIKMVDIFSRCKKIKEKHGYVGMIIIDYIQLMTGSGAQENRQQEVSSISRDLKILAKEFDCPVLALSQLNRKLEERPNKRPLLSDLRESGCVVGSTEILMADGSNRTIQDIFDSKDNMLEVATLNTDTQQYETGIMTHAFDSGVKEVFEVETASGDKITLTGCHKIKTYNGYTRLEDLNIGDMIHTPRDTSQFFEVDNETVDDQELILLAHLIGDGTLGVNNTLRYCTNDKTNGEVVEKAAMATLGSECKWDWNERSNCHQLRIVSPYVPSKVNASPGAQWAKPLGLWGKRSSEKFIPQSIIKTMSLRQVKLFLHHLWATDGSLGGEASWERKKRTNIYYSTTSEKLAYQVKELLLSVGIKALIRISENTGPTIGKVYNSSYNIHVSGKESQLIFLEEIGCHGVRGDSILERIEHVRNLKTNTNIDLYPWEIWADIKADLYSHGTSQREFSRKMDEKHGGSYSLGGNKSGHFRHLTRDRAKTMYDRNIIVEIGLENQLMGNVFWDKIVSIEPKGEQQVFDATVLEHHNFVANGISVHNSLEQDSDNIIFLYRDETYYPATADQGICEFIVAKHRQGKSGTARLAFLPNTVSFHDLALA